MEKTGILKKVTLFVLITYLTSWGLWMIAYGGDSTNSLLALVGACMPSIVGAFFLVFDKTVSKTGFGKRVYSFRRIGFKQVLIIFLFYPIILILSVIAHKLTGGTVPPLSDMLKALSNPSQLFIFIFMGFGAGLGEEFGWRGYMLELLQRRWNAFTSSIVVGLAWAAWHIPLRIVQKVHGFELFISLFMIFLLSFLFTWIYNNSNRSILSVMIAHGMVNFSTYILGSASNGQPLPIGLNVFITLFHLVFTIIIIWVYKPDTFTRKLSAES